MVGLSNHEVVLFLMKSPYPSCFTALNLIDCLSDLQDNLLRCFKSLTFSQVEQRCMTPYRNRLAFWSIYICGAYSSSDFNQSLKQYNLSPKILIVACKKAQSRVKTKGNKRWTMLLHFHKCSKGRKNTLYRQQK